MINKNKKIIAISLASLFILLIGLFIYRQPIEEQLIASRNRIEIANTIESFYKSYIEAINTNLNWPALIEKYTADRAQEVLSINAVFFMENASRGSQHSAIIASPIYLRFYGLNKDSAKVLVDFGMEQNMVGNPKQRDEVKKLLVLEKVGNRWVIVEDLDRSDRFNQWANQQNFPTARVAY